MLVCVCDVELIILPCFQSHGMVFILGDICDVKHSWTLFPKGTLFRTFVIVGKLLSWHEFRVFGALLIQNGISESVWMNQAQHSDSKPHTGK